MLNNNRRQRARTSIPRRNSRANSNNFDSNGPGEERVRGSAVQICEKYKNLARDARATGDYILSENYFQHADHYQRLISAEPAQHSNRQDHAARQERAPHKDPSSRQHHPGQDKPNHRQARRFENDKTDHVIDNIEYDLKSIPIPPEINPIVIKVNKKENNN